MAKARRNASKRAKYVEAQKNIRAHVSSDEKIVPYVSIQGYKYLANFVNPYSRLGICYLMWNKSEVLDCFKILCAELAYYGHRVERLNSDRGSDYFS